MTGRQIFTIQNRQSTRRMKRYRYMRIDVGPARNNYLTMALAEVGDLIERASDMSD